MTRHRGMKLSKGKFLVREEIDDLFGHSMIFQGRWKTTPIPIKLMSIVKLFHSVNYYNNGFASPYCKILSSKSVALIHLIKRKEENKISHSEWLWQEQPVFRYFLTF